MGTSIELSHIANPIPREEADFFRDNIADLFKERIRKFPGAQPVSFARRHLRELAERDYFLVEKTDGLRCLLYCHEIGGPPQEAQFLIDRKNDYYHIPSGYLHLPPPSEKKPGYVMESWHLNTLLDGELVRQRWPNGKEQLTFLIFDILALDGVDLREADYGARIGKIDRKIIKPWEAFARDWPDEARVQPFQLALKKPQAPYGTEMMFREMIPKLPHGNDGLIFTCKDTKYVCGTDQHILKWKPPMENTVDFRLQLGGFPMETDEETGERYEDFDAKPEFKLLVFHGEKDHRDDYRPYTDLHLEDREWEAMKTMGQMFDWRILECWRDAQTGRWRPKIEKDGKPRFRDDKDHANHISVVNSVIESIEDAVSEEDLIAAAARIKAGWKERERQAKEKEQRDRMQHQQQQQQQRLAAQGPPPQQVRKVSAENDGPGYTD